MTNKQPFHTFLGRLGRSPSLDDSTLDPDDVLPGLSPNLVIDLARLVGTPRDELEVTMQLLTFGDRAVMAAYGLIELEGSSGDRIPLVTVKPFCYKVMEAAADFVSASVDADAVASKLQAAASSSHFDEPYVPLATAAQQSSAGAEVVVAGVVRQVKPKSRMQMRVKVALLGDVTHTAAKTTIRVVTDARSGLRRNTRVQLALGPGDTPLSISNLEDN